MVVVALNVVNFQGKGNVLKSPNDLMIDSLTGGEGVDQSETLISKPQRPFTLQVSIYLYV